MTVADLIAILQKHDPRLMVLVDGQELSVGDVQQVHLRKVKGTPAFGDYGKPRYELDDDGEIKGLEIG